MCRLLLVQSSHEFDPSPYLERFAELCRTSTEYQGHGWGVTRRSSDDEPWDRYRSLTPIWEDDVTRFEPARSILAHARSAFRDEDIVLENNMPFVNDEWCYAFNGELRGVRVRAEGRTGAARIWNLIQRAQSTGLSMHDALERTVAMLTRQSQYIRAINIFMTNGATVLGHSTFNESPEYFTLQRWDSADGRTRLVCSEQFPVPSSSDRNPEASAWVPVPNNTTFSW